MKPRIWKRLAPWILLFSIPWLLWLFGLGAFWSIRDRVLGAECPLPWPLMRVHWPDKWVSVPYNGPDARVPRSGWPEREFPIPPGHYGPLAGGCANAVRVRPNAVYYYAQPCDLQLATPLWVALGLTDKEVKKVEWPRPTPAP